MKALMKHWPFLTALVAAALSLTAQAAHSANITVDTGGVCTLAEAIDSANKDMAFANGCVDGSGTDTIVLQEDVLLADNLPPIASVISIEGNGHKIDGQNNSSVGSVL